MVEVPLKLFWDRLSVPLKRIHAVGSSDEPAPHSDAAAAEFYRAWIDLARGALPLRIEKLRGPGPPDNTMLTQRIVELPGGAFYPADTLAEHWILDPQAPAPSQDDWDQFHAGRRRLPVAVDLRHRWDCRLVETRADLGDDFFVLTLPAGHRVWDCDARKVIGALVDRPLVQVGQPAPPLSIGRWVDGRERSLEQLRGQVVVLDFWARDLDQSWHDKVSQLKALRERFRGQPVAFITIHLAERDQAALAAELAAFQQKHPFDDIAAIDAGQMYEDSATRHAYGVTATSFCVIVGRDGRIAYVDPQLDGPRCNEPDPRKVAAFRQQIEQHWKDRFAAVGETWTSPGPASQADHMALCQKVEQLYISQQIEAALAAGV